MRRAIQWSADTVLRTNRTANALHLGLQRRQAHSALGLTYKITDGLGRFMSPKTLDLVAMDYQRGLLQRLDAEVKGTAHVACTIPVSI